jgi:hypothetical protein
VYKGKIAYQLAARGELTFREIYQERSRTKPILPSRMV